MQTIIHIFYFIFDTCVTESHFLHPVSRNKHLSGFGKKFTLYTWSAWSLFIFISLFLYLPLSLSVSIMVHFSLCSCNSLSISRPLSLCFYLSILIFLCVYTSCFRFYLLLFLNLYLSVYIRLYLYISLSISLFISLSIFISLCFYIFLS